MESIPESLRFADAADPEWACQEGHVVHSVWAIFGGLTAESTARRATHSGGLAASLGIAIIDVSGVEKGAGVLLRRQATTKERAQYCIEWGRAPSAEDAALDPPADAKIGRLRLAAARFPGLRGIRTVRLGFDDLVVVPL